MRWSPLNEKGFVNRAGSPTSSSAWISAETSTPHTSSLSCFEEVCHVADSAYADFGWEARHHLDARMSLWIL